MHIKMTQRFWVGSTLCALLTPVGIGVAGLPTPVLSVPLAIAQTPTTFVSPPQLVGATTTRSLVSELNATYYLTLDLPATAGVGLQTVEIRLDEGRDPTFHFQVEATQAFEGTREARGAVLPLASVVEDRDRNAITLQFDPAVAPGRSLTLALRPRRNPRFEGVYLFGVTAAPPGSQAEPYFTGYARLHFYEIDNDPFP